MTDTIRTFIAFELPGHIVRLAEALQQDLKNAGLKLSWVQPRNIHLTLKFLGNVSKEHIDGIPLAMQKASQGRPPMVLTVQGMGVFPGLRRPRVMWIGLGGETEALIQLQVALDTGLADLGFEKEKRPFKAHLTLARMPDRVDAGLVLRAIEAKGDFISKPFACNELVHFQSDLQPRGAVYTPLAKVLLA